MPLHIERLRRSKAWFMAKQQPELAFYLINLWTGSWHQIPAASLEDDDAMLCAMAECHPRRWTKVKADVLRGWIKCSDGRLYHPVVAELARDSWDKKQQLSQQGKLGNAKRWANREIAAGSRGDRQAIAGRLGGDGKEKRREEKMAVPPILLADKEGRFDLPGVIWRESDGRPEVNGTYLDTAWEMVEAAGNLFHFTGNLGPLVQWLADGITLATIVAAVRKVASRPSYSPQRTLAYFNNAVREHWLPVEAWDQPVEVD
jgi:hypothetical protein